MEKLVSGNRNGKMSTEGRATDRSEPRCGLRRGEEHPLPNGDGLQMKRVSRLKRKGGPLNTLNVLLKTCEDQGKREFRSTC